MGSLDLLKGYTKHIAALLLIPLAAMAVSALVSWFYLPSIYRATTTFEVYRTEVLWYGWGVGVGTREIEVNRQLVEHYLAITRNQGFFSRVISDADLDWNPAILDENFRAEFAGHRNVIRFRVDDRNPVRAKKLTILAVNEFARRLKLLDELNGIRIIKPATQPRLPVKPEKKQNVIRAGVVGFVFAFGLCTILAFQNPNSYRDKKSGCET